MVKERFKKGVGVLFCALIALNAALGSADALTRFQIIRDPWRGLAIYGYDPIAYLTDERAREGSDDILFLWQDTIWRFANEGNRAIFQADPDLYAPAYGGYDAVSLSRGYPAEGNAELFAVYEQKVYLFYSAANRHVFLIDPRSFIERANHNWQAIATRLPL